MAFLRAIINDISLQKNYFAAATSSIARVAPKVYIGCLEICQAIALR